MSMRKLIALEEHLATPEVAEAWGTAPGTDWDRADVASMMDMAGEALLDVGKGRIAAMESLSSCLCKLIYGRVS